MKIFVIIQAQWSRDLVGAALCEDGHVLASHISSTREWVRHDLGVSSERRHDVYGAHCPDGFTVVDLTELGPEEMVTHPGLVAAIAKNQAHAAAAERETP